MTKKEIAELCCRKCVVNTTEVHLGRGLEVRYLVSFGLSGNELIVLKDILNRGEHFEENDLKAYINNALTRADIEIK